MSKKELQLFFFLTTQWKLGVIRWSRVNGDGCWLTLGDSTDVRETHVSHLPHCRLIDSGSIWHVMCILLRVAFQQVRTLDQLRHLGIFSAKCNINLYFRCIFYPHFTPHTTCNDCGNCNSAFFFFFFFPRRSPNERENWWNYQIVRTWDDLCIHS